MRLSTRVITILCIGGWCVASPAHADLVRGVKYVVIGALQLPVQAVAGTVSGPLILGTLGGIAKGAVGTVVMVTQGLVEIIGSIIPLIGKLAPLIPVFL